VEETKRMKSIDKAILGMVSESLGRNESERTGDLETYLLQMSRCAKIAAFVAKGAFLHLNRGRLVGNCTLIGSSSLLLQAMPMV